ncbi:MAG: tyrosine recombinase XerC, partial [Akkermansia sp.]
MKNQTVTEKLLEHLPLRSEDAARIVLEMHEELGEWAQGLGREELLRLLRRVLRLGTVAVTCEMSTVSFAEAAWASVEARADRRAVTRRDLRNYVRRMLRVEGVAQRPLRSMSTAECRELLQQAFPGSMHSFRKGRAILHSVFAYGRRCGWCADNPVSAVECPRVAERHICPLTLGEMGRLRRAAAKPEHADMQLSLHLMACCGIRPAEVRRLNPDTDIDWRARVVIVRSTCSKTGGGRVVPLRGVSLLRGCPRRIPRNWQMRWQRLRRAAGFRQWVPDVLRHSFAR